MAPMTCPCRILSGLDPRPTSPHADAVREAGRCGCDCHTRQGRLMRERHRLELDEVLRERVQANVENAMDDLSSRSAQEPNFSAYCLAVCAELTSRSGYLPTHGICQACLGTGRDDGEARRCILCERFGTDHA